MTEKLLHRQPGLDRLIGIKYEVLNGGHVILLDAMGSDASIVAAARTSYGPGTKKRSEDLKLLRYLLKNKHTSPFEQVVLKFHMKLPIFVARQMVRHRTARLNEMSGRYTEIPHEFYIPEAANSGDGVILRGQDTANKQGSMGLVEVSYTLFQQWLDNMTDAFKIYEALVAAGVAKELARIHLPVATYTEWVWQMDLHNLMHFLRLRLHSHAQEEIRVYAMQMYWIAHSVAPETMRIFVETLADDQAYSL